MHFHGKALLLLLISKQEENPRDKLADAKNTGRRLREKLKMKNHSLYQLLSLSTRDNCKPINRSPETWKKKKNAHSMFSLKSPQLRFE